VIDPFVFEGAPSRVVFGRGTLRELPSEAARLGMQRALVLSTPQQRMQAESIATLLGPLCVGILPRAVMHTPVDVTETAMRHVVAVRADGVVAVGGGSTIGLGKAIAVRTDLPQLVVPTTYAGSEMTPILGETNGGRKVTQRDPRILPKSVIYDVELTLGLPAAMSAASGMNAIAHAVEALYAQNGNPIVSLMAEEGIRALARALPAIVATPAAIDARSSALYGAWLCGSCLGAAGMALHHKLCHTLGGMFDLPHAETHAILLPYATAYNTAAAPDAMRRIAEALGARDAATGLRELALQLPLPRALRDLGMPKDGVDRATNAALQSPYWNPQPIERDAVRALIARAWAGEAVRD